MRVITWRVLSISPLGEEAREVRRDGHQHYGDAPGDGPPRVLVNESVFRVRRRYLRSWQGLTLIPFSISPEPFRWDAWDDFSALVTAQVEKRSGRVEAPPLVLGWTFDLSIFGRDGGADTDEGASFESVPALNLDGEMVGRCRVTPG